MIKLGKVDHFGIRLNFGGGIIVALHNSVNFERKMKYAVFDLNKRVAA